MLVHSFTCCTYTLRQFCPNEHGLCAMKCGVILFLKLNEDMSLNY